MSKILNLWLVLGMLLAAGCTLPGAGATPSAAPPALPTSAPETQTPLPAPTLPTAPPTEATSPAPTLTPQNASVITLQNAASLTQTALVEAASPYRLAWSADSARLGVFTLSGLELLDGKTLQTLANVQIQDPYFLLSFSPEANLMAVTADMLTIELRDVYSGEVLRTIERATPAYFAEFSPDGTKLAVGTTDQFAVEMWSVETAVLEKTLSGFTTAAPVYAATFSADGKFLIWYARASVQVMHIASGQLGPALSHEDFVSGLALAPDDRLLAAGVAAQIGEDYTPIIQLWDSNAGQAVGRLVSPQGVPVSLSFSPDGRLLAAGAAREVILWDVQNQREVTRLRGFNDALNAAVFSPDGKTLATSASDGTVRLWQVLE